ncbi:calcium-activated chloride channel regulator 1-like [Hyla sarda]|uniref:calcium-activated chloride channel regulator 1-like n=1 Tax=Hyla sarda TaxID=327740 RepID=UPI0024C31A4B|nr:calcium-activated chloride channel regulator 1-like [Hyla sarda]
MAAWGVLALLGFQVFFLTEASMARCQAGGYEDIVIAIDPGVPENVAILETIQTMVKEASHYLFNATRQRLYIRSAKILLPRTWSLNYTKYTNRTRERYEKADVVIANMFPRIGDAPYTKQYGGCGEPGRYIHLTPNFLLQENLTSLYGPYGKVFVHEWAHLRWGVFKEHNPNEPFYITGKSQVEATRCSANINGTYRVPHVGPSCVTRPCSIDPSTGLFAKGCTFFPEKTLSAGESLMYSPGLHSVSEFCDETSHNIEAPTMQNRMCDCRSTWDIIRNHRDIVSAAPREDFNMSEPTFSLLRYKERVITLLIDVSQSMNTNNRFGRVRQAADMFFTESIAEGTYLGIVEVSIYSYPSSKLLQITDDSVREHLRTKLPPTVSDYGSDFCLGILEAFKINRESGSLPGTEIILLADGNDIKGSIRCLSDIEESGVVIHTVALSNEATKELEKLADMTGGLKYFVADQEESHDLIDAFVGIANENGGNSARVSQMESATFSVNPTQCISDTVYMDSTAGAETFFTVTWQYSDLSINLENPNGKIYSTADFTTVPASHLSRLKIPEVAASGAWNFTLCNNDTRDQVLGIVVTSKSAGVNEPPIIVNVHMNNDTNRHPAPMIVYASVSQGLLPVRGANVIAVITSEDGDRTALQLLDNGAGADIVKDDGVYSKYYFKFSASGRYGLKVRVTCHVSECRLVHPKNRVLHLPGFVENGKVMMNPSWRPEDDVLPVLGGSLQRTAAGESFMVSDVVKEETDVYPPGKITDLQAKRIDDTIVLSWTAPGDDLDIGSAWRYELGVSNNIAELRDDFWGSVVVDVPLKPSSAGSRENYTFIPNHDEEDIVVFYFSLVSVDENLQKSAPSNIAQAAIGVPSFVAQCPTQKPRTCTTKHVQVCDAGSTSAPTQPAKCPSKPKPKCPTN